MKVGIGYDIHPMGKGRKLILGGVEIPHTQGLVGHSDAVRVIAFAPDLIHLTTGSADGTLMHWPLPLEAQPVGQ